MSKRDDWREMWPPAFIAKDPEACVRQLLQYLGEDPIRKGLLDTPKRFIKALLEMTAGYSISPTEILKTFEDGAEGYDEMVIEKGIPVSSLCEHHLLPFYGVAHIGYIPTGKIVGISKLARLTDIFSRRLQVQERLTTEIAEALNAGLKPKGVGVVIECSHMCMQCRGVKVSGTTVITSKLLGAIREKPEARAEFMSLIGQR